MWGGHERLWQQLNTEYIVVLSVDVVMADDFIERAIEVIDKNSKIGALQAKIYQFDIDSYPASLASKTIDTCGFQIQRSRRVTNIGHGEEDHGQFDKAGEIFGVEGAVPVFRKTALDSIRIGSSSNDSEQFPSEIADHDLFWYAEDLDVAWRIRLAGWQEWYDPSIIAWHDRGTTKSQAHGGWLHYISRVPARHQVSLKKRRLEWRNTRWTRIKNDYIINVLKDLPYILWREIEVLGYTILFEPGVLAELPRFIKLIPKMLKKRSQILSKAKVTPEQIHQFFK